MGGGLLVQGLARQGLPLHSLGPNSPCDLVPGLGRDQGRPALGVPVRTSNLGSLLGLLQLALERGFMGCWVSCFAQSSPEWSREASWGT